MESSSSDTGSECFESAEETLDENNELESKKVKSKKNLSKNVGEVVEPVFFDNNTIDSTDQLAENISNLSYRKRPERVKHILNKSLRKSTSKLPSSEIIFNTEKTVSDVLFQDITSSLSKNINKSLSTLQQTSSNVKDLILSSLPVSSVNDNEEFSYDDKNVSSSLIETDSNTESSSHISNQSETPLRITEKLVENEEKDNERKLTFSQIVTNSSLESKISGDDAVVKPICIRTDNLRTEDNFKNSITDDIVKQEITGLYKEANKEQFVNTSSSFDCVSKAAGDKSEQNMKAMHEEKKENLNDFFETFSSNRNPKTLDDQEDTNNEEIIRPDLVIISNNNIVNIDQQNKKHDVLEENCTNNVELLDKEPIENEENKKNFLQEKYFESIVPDELSSENNLIYSEITNDNRTLTTKGGNDYTYMSEDKSKVNSECNVEELKIALKNIFKEKNDNEEIIAEKVEKKLLKEDSSLKENVKVNLNSNDEWDDFDFNDNEVENINQSDKDKNIKKDERNLNEKELKKNKAEVVKSKSVGENIEVENQKSKVSVSIPTNLRESSVSKKKLSTKDIKNADLIIEEKNNVKEEDHKKIEKTVQSIESKLVGDDSWDWDNWDEIPDNKEKVEFRSTENPLNKKTDENDFFDVSKWSGWDTFGQKPQEKQGNWNLGSWGVDALLNKATAVTQGISNVIEAGLGAPDPETLLKLEKEEKKKLKEQENEKSEVECKENSAENFKKNSLSNVSLFPVSGITSLVAGVTSKIVEHSKIQEIGSKVITGGLDTLETFGKKTMEVLQEGDPGLKNKRALLLGNNKPVLSQVLKEAREKADKEIKKAEEKEIAKKCHFETLFDDFQGMVHLEALEMLSRQGELKLEQIKSGMNSEELEDLNGILEEVEQLCSLEEFNINMKSLVIDFKTELQMAVEPLKNEISIQRIVQILEDVNKWLKMARETKPSIILINQKLVSILAELTAATVHQFHKSGELLSVKECRKTVEEVDALSKLTNVLCKEINRLGEKFLLLSHSTSCIDNTGKNVNSFNENVAVVVNNSTLYIRQAFNLLIPVIQLGAAV